MITKNGFKNKVQGGNSCINHSGGHFKVENYKRQYKNLN